MDEFLGTLCLDYNKNHTLTNLHKFKWALRFNFYGDSIMKRRELEKVIMELRIMELEPH